MKGLRIIQEEVTCKSGEEGRGKQKRWKRDREK
jgi:hypothetical protein